MYSLPINDLELIAEALKMLWPRKKKFLITGGTGFLGRWIIESIAFLEEMNCADNEFTVVSRQSSKDVFSKIPVLKKSCFQILRTSVEDLTSFSGELDYVIDAASDVSGAKHSVKSSFFFERYTRGTKNILEIAKAKRVRKFLYVSSGAVYAGIDMPANGYAEVDFELAPADEAPARSYAQSKQKSERIVQSYANVFPVNIARCFSFVGPFIDDKMAVSQFINRKIENQSIVVKSPHVVRSYMYPIDLVIGLFTILLGHTEHQVYNLGSDQPISLLDLANSIESNDANVFVDPAAQVSARLAGDTYFPDMNLIKSNLNFNITIKLSEALKRTLDFQRKKVST